MIPSSVVTLCIVCVCVKERETEYVTQANSFRGCITYIPWFIWTLVSLGFHACSQARRTHVYTWEQFQVEILKYCHHCITTKCSNTFPLLSSPPLLSPPSSPPSSSPSSPLLQYVSVHQSPVRGPVHLLHLPGCVHQPGLHTVRTQLLPGVHLLLLGQ